MSDPTQLTRRERQLLHILYEQGPSTVAQVQEALGDDVSYSTVRTLLGLMEDKGHLVHHTRGRAYVYAPAVPAERAAHSALQGLVRTFFGGSAAEAISALLDGDLSDDEMARVEAMIAEARAQGGEG
jgi:predicted transcriptional regulator